jgi:hypothetical protein
MVCVSTALIWSGGYPALFHEPMFKSFKECYLRRMSPGTGSIRSPIVHSPFVPALPPMGGRPPTSTTWNTSTSSCTRPERARAMAVERWNRASVSREGGGGDDVLLGMLDDMCSFAAEMLRLRDASVSRRARSLSRSCGTSEIPMN